MKKTLSLVLVIILSLALLSACAPSSTDTINEDNEGLSLPNLTVVNKEHSYYTTIKDSDIEYIGNDFPSERGTYIKLLIQQANLKRVLIITTLINRYLKITMF